MPWFRWRPEIKSVWMWSTKAFNTHWKNQKSRNFALKEQQYQILKAKDKRALGTSLLIELRVVVLTKRHVGSGNEIGPFVWDTSGLGESLTGTRLGPVHGRRNLKAKFSLWKRIKCSLFTLPRRNLKTQHSPVILDLRLRKTWAGKSRDYRDAFVFVTD